jgi:hypothetical protein
MQRNRSVTRASPDKIREEKNTEGESPPLCDVPVTPLLRSGDANGVTQSSQANVEFDEARDTLIEIAKRVFDEEIHTWGLNRDYDDNLRRVQFPIKRSKFEDFKWFYSLDDDDPIFQKQGLTYRRTNFRALTEFLEAEMQKAVKIRKKMDESEGIDPIPE